MCGSNPDQGSHINNNIFGTQPSYTVPNPAYRQAYDAKQPLLTGEQNGCYAWTKNQHNIIIPLSPSSCLSLDHNRTHPRTAETETLRCLCKPLSGEEEPDLGAEKIKDHLQPYTKLIWVRQDQGK